MENQNKKLIVSPENGNGILVDMTAEEITEKETMVTETANRKQAEQDAETAKENLKASAKAKLIAGETLTEDEANTIVL